MLLRRSMLLRRYNVNIVNNLFVMYQRHKSLVLLLSLSFEILAVRGVKVEIAEVLRWKLLRHLHIVAIAVAQILVGLLHTHQRMSLKLHWGGGAIHVFGQDATLGLIIVIGH